MNANCLLTNSMDYIVNMFEHVQGALYGEGTGVGPCLSTHTHSCEQNNRQNDINFPPLHSLACGNNAVIRFTFANTGTFLSTLLHKFVSCCFCDCYGDSTYQDSRERASCKFIYKKCVHIYRNLQVYNSIHLWKYPDFH